MHRKDVFNSTETSQTEARIDINSAGVEELQTLPGIGLKRATAIVDYRHKYGRFHEISQLMLVKGIGKKRFQKIKNFVYVSSQIAPENGTENVSQK
ncbi:MAG: ComEA family DNA-binding protein [Pyrinomonadaceae bacterium]